ncbi:hypothetical protein [Portibacter marinus]|uniref:hypothetical protein n=1 Tax=Portibacter marinus TaxID=2898660 RepID=UPI001F2A3D92|nr:hypothetical protein [Portibacter marinus]
MFKRLKSVFIVEDEDYVPTEIAEDESKEKKEANIPVNENAKASDKFVNSLLRAIESNNLEGFDYLEYKQSLKSLSSMDMDESTRFNSAFAMAKTMGADKKALMDSAMHYLKVLENEKGKFNDAYEKQQQKQVIARQDKLTALESSISKKEAQIKKLQEEIKQSKKELEIRKNEISEASEKVARTRDQFYASFSKVADQITADVDRMKKYLNS